MDVSTWFLYILLWVLKMIDKKIYVTQTSMPPFEEYVQAIKPLWNSHWITNMGRYHQELEQSLKEYLGVPEISLLVNGHMALEMVIQAMDFPEGTEIITTPFTFISTTHAIVRNRLKPVFCDIKPEDGTIDENKIEELITEHTVAIVPVHVYGNVCNVEEIQRIAERYNLKVIYDAAHAFGVRYKEKGIGSYGDASVFSFHATKVFHSIEGGAVTFADHKLYDKLYNLKNFGIRGEESVLEIGANAKMNEFCAIMGLCNLKYINKSIKKRKLRYEYYIQNLKGIEGIHFFENNIDIKKNYAYFPIIVEDNYIMSRDELYDYLKSNNIYSRKYFYPLTCDQECYEDEYKNVSLEQARRQADHILTLPLYEELELNVIEKITKLMKR